MQDSRSKKLNYKDYLQVIKKPFKLCPRPKVMIIGQDPYPGGDENGPYACGLAFSVEGIRRKLPRTIKNIMIESGRYDPDLTDWANQGVLLINETSFLASNVSHLPYEDVWSLELAHYNLICKSLLKNRVLVVSFGGKAKKFALEQQTRMKYVAGVDLECIHVAHPSPRSANRGFLGSGIFTKINDWCIMNGYEPIDWKKQERKWAKN